MHSYSDKSGQCKGNVKEGVIYVWLKDIPKRDFCASVSIAEIDSSLGVYGNSNYVLYEIAKKSYWMPMNGGLRTQKIRN